MKAHYVEGTFQILHATIDELYDQSFKWHEALVIS